MPLSTANNNHKSSMYPHHLPTRAKPKNHPRVALPNQDKQPSLYYYEPKPHAAAKPQRQHDVSNDNDNDNNKKHHHQWFGRKVAVLSRGDAFELILLNHELVEATEGCGSKASPASFSSGTALKFNLTAGRRVRTADVCYTNDHHQYYRSGRSTSPRQRRHESYPVLETTLGDVYDPKTLQPSSSTGSNSSSSTKMTLAAHFSKQRSTPTTLPVLLQGDDDEWTVESSSSYGWWKQYYS